jgi:hypothetical protein
MGATASVELAERLDEATVRSITGESFNFEAFEAHKDG